MEDEEELKAQCYGGEYMSEVFDPLVKRMSYRKQKRWWNAFMLFYTRVDYTQDENESLLKEMALLSIGKLDIRGFFFKETALTERKDDFFYIELSFFKFQIYL